MVLVYESLVCEALEYEAVVEEVAVKVRLSVEVIVVLVKVPVNVDNVAEVAEIEMVLVPELVVDVRVVVLVPVDVVVVVGGSEVHHTTSGVVVMFGKRTHKLTVPSDLRLLWI